jgi:hypothetical protein
VMTQVGLGLTSVSRFDSADSAISRNNANQKHGASHPTPSSVGSIANAKHLVDDIVEDTPCKLVIPYGRKLDKFREVGTAMGLTGRVFPNSPPPEYAWVQVVSVSDESCEIDIPTEDGIKLLGDARNQYILWHRRDVILNVSPSPCLQPSQERVPPPGSRCCNGRVHNGWGTWRR